MWSTLRRPATFGRALHTSFGLAIATLIGAVPLMLLWRQGALLVAAAGLTLYSIADPTTNTRRRSWWLGAVVSSGVFLALLMALAGIAEAIQPMREDAMIFMVPMMLFAGGTVVSGINRFRSVLSSRRSAHR